LAGLLCFSTPHARTWTQHEIVTLTSTAESLALAIKNARAEQERQRVEEQLRHDALHDTLTGLPNRTLFMDRLGHALARMKRRPDYLYAVLFLDLDRFKVVNDSLGHLMGDELLMSISRRLQACLRTGDTVARLGGDEFAILLDDLTDVEQVLEVSERIQQALAQPVMLGGHEVRSSASIGITMSRTGYDLPSDVLRDADLALYRAKSKGRACHEVYDQALHTRAVTLMQLETDLQRALEREELLLHYQPIVSLTTGRVTAFEALARWRHPQHGLISPADFIPVAEDSGLIVQLGQWALREACSQMQAWRTRFPAQSNLSICVNLSAKQFAQPDLVEQIARILRETGLDPSALGLEITESVMMEQADRAAAMLTQFRDLHIPLHLDDFGTGYSSLSYLHRFPIDLLKIDRSFVSRIGEGGQNSEIVQAIVGLAHNLKIEVIAEGVETAEQLTLLRTLQCDYGQGYYFSRPLEAHAVEALLTAEVPWFQLAEV
jgi:diguanylate cyclase (GGDEF)-like protein